MRVLGCGVLCEVSYKFEFLCELSGVSCLDSVRYLV